MPIHQTKLIMAKPQATGWVMAQMPVPLRNSHVTATNSTVAPAPATPKKANHPSGVCGVSTMRDIFSVTDRKVCPGAMTLYSPVAGSIFGFFRSLVAMFALTLHRQMFHRRFFQFLVRIQDRRHIPGSRTSIQIGKYLVAALIAVQFGYLARLIVDVTESNGRCRAGLLACSNNFAVANGTVLF